MKPPIVILTGAGISAESDLKTFRDSNGLWEGHQVEDIATPTAFGRNAPLVHDFYNKHRRQLLTVSPNKAHQALAQDETRTLFNEAETDLPTKAAPLLIPIIKNGKRTLPQEPLATIRAKALTNWANLKTNPAITQLHPDLEQTKRQLLTANGFHP